AGSSFVFWAGMRGVSIGLKGLWKLTKIYMGWKSLQLAYKGLDVAKKRGMGFLKYLTHTDQFEDLIADKLDEFVKQGRLVSVLTDKLGEADAMHTIKYLGEVGFIETTVDPATGALRYYAVGDKLLFKQTDIPATVVETVPDPMVRGGFIEKVKEIAVYSSTGSIEDADWNKIELLDVGQAPPPNHIKIMINPKEQMEYIYKSLKEAGQEQRAKDILEYFTTDPTGKTEEWDFTKPSLIKKLYNVKDGVKKRISEFKDYLKRNLYLDTDEYTMQTGKEVARRAEVAKEIAELDPGKIMITLSDGSTIDLGEEFREKIVRQLLKSKDYGPKLKQRIKFFASQYGIPIQPDITPKDAVKVFERVWKEEGGGFAFYHESDLTRSFVRMGDIITTTQGGAINVPPAYGGRFADFVIDELKKLPKYDEYFGVYEARLRNFANQLQSDYITVAMSQPPGTPLNVINDIFAKKLEEFQLTNLVKELAESEKGLNSPEIQELMENQLRMIVGIYDKDYNAMPIPLEKLFAIKYAKKQFGKMLFIDGTAFVPSNSWIGKGLILGQMTKGCKGNSICLYIHASQYEDPYYLSENATSYTVRVWRPVEVWKQWAGWQAALARIPSHPRFYVVSPCFAVAKVWKTNLEGEPTIFVYPIKVDVEGRSNYCYADTALVNAYTTIWATSDILTIAETILTLGTSSAKTGLKLTLKNTLERWGIFDPVTFGQVMAEAAISWPGYPYTDLNYTDMQEGSKNYEGFKELENALKSTYG
nr:hypothetical protein [Nanoarchaeum sp.]